MVAKYQVIALSSLDPDGTDTRKEPVLSYSEALQVAEELKSQGKAFRVHADGQTDDEHRQKLLGLGALF